VREEMRVRNACRRWFGRACREETNLVLHELAHWLWMVGGLAKLPRDFRAVMLAVSARFQCVYRTRTAWRHEVRALAVQELVIDALAPRCVNADMPLDMDEFIGRVAQNFGEIGGEETWDAVARFKRRVSAVRQAARIVRWIRCRMFR
jgi:hypothetical protein